jgi:uncharacterized membrane protein
MLFGADVDGVIFEGMELIEDFFDFVAKTLANVMVDIGVKEEIAPMSTVTLLQYYYINYYHSHRQACRCLLCLPFSYLVGLLFLKTSASALNNCLAALLQHFPLVSSFSSFSIVDHESRYTYFLSLFTN